MSDLWYTLEHACTISRDFWGVLVENKPENSINWPRALLIIGVVIALIVGLQFIGNAIFSGGEHTPCRN